MLAKMDQTRDDARNSGVRQNVKKVQYALEAYAADHDGHLPAREEWLAVVAKVENVHGDNGRPVNPFAEGRKARNQRRPVPLGPLMPAAPEVFPTVEGAELGAGHAPKSHTYDALTYGAIACDIDQERDVYVIYGVGKRGDQAVVVAVATNDNDPTPGQ